MFKVRPASPADVPAAAAMAAELVRGHHAFDPKRFFVAENLEEGYAYWFGRELKSSEAILLVAEEEHSGRIGGYAYGRVEPRDWNMLLGAHVALHDIFVAVPHRKSGIARILLLAFIEAAQSRAPRIVLHTATQNSAAQALFREAGFRTTMLEMTRELD